MQQHRRKLTLALSLASLLGLATMLFVFAALSDHPQIFPLRNTLLYQYEQWRTAQFGPPAPPARGAVQGCIRTAIGNPAAAALILIAERDGTTHSTSSDAAGCYQLDDLPAHRAVPMIATATGASYAAPAVQVHANTRITHDITLPAEELRSGVSGANLRLGAPVTLTHPLPSPSSAFEQQLWFDTPAKPYSDIFYYTPLTVTETSRLPVLLIVYPGPAAAWRGVSIPLAAAGYSVIGVGPEYALDLAADIDILQTLVQFVRAGWLPHADPRQIVLMGGSYSSLHVFGLLQRDTGFQGAVLLGPPTDLFELRRQFEAGDFFPPFGLDRALIALGFPDTQPQRFFTYSPRFHVRPHLPPILLLHSRTDEVVPFAQSELLAAELARQNVPHQAVFFDNLSHYLRADQPSPDLDLMYRILLDFLAEVVHPSTP